MSPEAFWNGVGAVAISAIVALATSIVFRWLDRRGVSWVVTGEAHEEFDGGRRTGRVRIELAVHNAGDASAYDVRVRRCNGDKYPSWVTFESPVVAPGQSMPIKFSCPPETWESAWMEIIARPNRAQGSKPKTFRRVVLRDVTGNKTDGPRPRDPDGWGTDLPAADGGRL